MSRVVEALAPARMGSSFRWLMASSWASNLGDGIMLAAGPLLVASQSRSPVLVSLAVLLQRLPWLLFGLVAGALADRLDRRRLVIVADLLRAAVLAVLCLAILTDAVDIVVVLVSMFLIGTAEAFADTTASTLLPMLVDKADLGIANARLMAGHLTLNQLAGAPLGAFLFAAGMVVPFAAQIVCVLLAVVLMARIATEAGPVRTLDQARIRSDIAEGVRWLIRHPPIRTLALVIFTFNVTWAAAWSILVLYSLDELDMGPVGFGLLTTATALGGLVATFSYGWLERHVPLAALMRTCLLLEVLMHVGLALTTAPWLALLIMFGFGCYAFIWGTLSRTVRQRAVPREFQGRVDSVYAVGVFGGLVLGAALGGPIASTWGLRGPFWFAFVGSGITLALVWRQLAHIAHADEAATVSA